MPDNGSPGELEDFIEAMIPASDTVLPRARHYVDSIPAEERKFKQQKTKRAILHAWLATRQEPRKMGAAIGTGDLDIDAQIAKDFYKWLQCLFRFEQS